MISVITFTINYSLSSNERYALVPGCNGNTKDLELMTPEPEHIRWETVVENHPDQHLNLLWYMNFPEPAPFGVMMQLISKNIILYLEPAPFGVIIYLIKDFKYKIKIAQNLTHI
jgi:hypothetical protein